MFASEVRQLIFLFVGIFSQGGVAVGELSEVHHVLLKRGSAVHGRGGHVVQVARQ